MNVTCTGCPAKYAVPDEKVRGKKVRITCKHCGTHIVVDGTTEDALPKPAAQAAPQAAASTPGASNAAATNAAAKAALDPKPAVQTKPSAASEAMFIVG